MARRRGRPGAYLMTDDYSGVTCYASELHQDWWGNYTKQPLKRNLQEIAVGLNDPVPVTVFRGPQYEVTNICDFEHIPIFIGRTNIRTPNTSPATQALGLDPGIGDAVIGCTFVVH